MSELLHFGNDDGLTAAAAKPGKIGVVDYAKAGAMTPEHQRFVKKALHFESVKTTVELQIASLGVSQVQNACDQSDALTSYFDSIEGGVMLHLRPRFVRHPVAPAWRRMTDAHCTQLAHQAGVWNLDIVLLLEDFMDPLAPAVARPA